jgi:hypothetical protein
LKAPSVSDRAQGISASIAGYSTVDLRGKRDNYPGSPAGKMRGRIASL